MYTQVIGKADELLKKHNIEEPIVNVFEITEKEGLDIKFVDMPESLNDVAGFFDEESKTIFVNNDDHPNRQMFTVAHELGHFILGHKMNEYGVLYRKQILNGENNQSEKEANCFAANLLVPKKMLESIMDKYSLKKKDDELLATLFGVSKEMMQYRLKIID